MEAWYIIIPIRESGTEDPRSNGQKDLSYMQIFKHSTFGDGKSMPPLFILESMDSVQFTQLLIPALLDYCIFPVTSSLILLAFLTILPKVSNDICCSLSDRAFSGLLWTSISSISAPEATAASARDST